MARPGRNPRRTGARNARARRKDEQKARDTRDAIDAQTAADIDTKRRVAVEASRKAAITHPVTFYKDGKWQTVDKTAMDFPIVEMQLVTPEWALDVLTNRNNLNRTVKKLRIVKYAKARVEGKWYTIPNGIGFYEDGTLADGQHRLEMVFESDMPTTFPVFYGVDPRAKVAIDEGAKRSSYDRAILLGYKNPSLKAISTANYILEQKNIRSTMPEEDCLDFYEQHHDAIHFVTEQIKTKGVTRAPVFAVIARAYYSVEKDVLQQFIDILQNGAGSRQQLDQMVNKFRDWLMGNTASNTGTFRLEVYQKTQTILGRFSDGEYGKNLVATSKELFPLPEERLGLL